MLADDYVRVTEKGIIYHSLREGETFFEWKNASMS